MCLVCYVIPVGIHLAVQRDQDRIQELEDQSAAVADGDLRAPLLAPAGPAAVGSGGSARVDLGVAGASGRVRRVKFAESAAARFVSRVALPAFILLVGVGFSVAGLYVGFVDLLNYLDDKSGGR